MGRIHALGIAVLVASSVAHAEERTFQTGSLIIPMDLAYQDRGLFQAFGLLFQLLRQGVPVAWVIDPAKTWHHAPCDTPGDLCAWDCAEEGSGTKCGYPTASPDFFAAATVLWDGDGALAVGAAIASHGYRGGPFVIDVAHAVAARAIVDAWNAPGPGAPWSQRSVIEVVTVHEATAPFVGFVAKDMVAAPTIAVFSDGNEDIATGYLRAAGIPQSSGVEFPAAKCGGTDCGPGTANPDMLTVPSIAGDMGTCAAPSADHENGALFTPEGVPAYCQIMSMHWGVNERETVSCGGGACPATQAACGDQPITYHGHEAVAEVRAFLAYPVHFFAECQAVNAYENTTPNPAWPYLDDAGRDGHFLTTQGNPPACPCTDADFECVVGGCAGGDCCLPRNAKELGAGFMIAAQPDAGTLKVLRAGVPYNQLDGELGTVGGSEPAYNLSAYLGTAYKNDREVTFLTGPNGPGDQDLWMTGYVDGSCDIGGDDDVGGGGTASCGGGKVSYLGGHRYSTSVPLSGNPDAQGSRLFLNALFEADCVTAAGQPALSLSIEGELVVAAQTVPVERAYEVRWRNDAAQPALEALLRVEVPDGTTVSEAGEGTIATRGATWAVGAIGGDPGGPGDPANAGGRPATLRFGAFGDVEVAVGLSYRAGVSTLEAPARTVTIRVLRDQDGDGVPDETDPAPTDPGACGDSDQDTCDDCANGPFDPGNDGADADGDGTCDDGEGGGGGGGGAGGDGGGCGCRVGRGPSPPGVGLLLGVVLALVLCRRCARRVR